MTINTLDDLIARLQRSRDAAGRNLPVRLKIEVGDAEDYEAPSHVIVSAQGLKVMPCISDDGEFVQIASAGAVQA